MQYKEFMGEVLIKEQNTSCRQLGETKSFLLRLMLRKHNENQKSFFPKKGPVTLPHPCDKTLKQQ